MIILAFPGLGKTTLSKLQGGFVDLDFDYYRKACDGLGVSRQVQLQLYVRLATRYAEEGFNVLLNEPEVLRVDPFLVDCMFVPEGQLFSRCAAKLGVDDVTAWNWKLDWMVLANRYSVPVQLTSAYLGPYQKKARTKGEFPFIPKRDDESRERSRRKRE